MVCTFQKIKKAEKTKLHTGPTTRSRANVLTASEKEKTEKEAKGPVVAEAVPTCTIKLPCGEGIGTMDAFMAMRKRQKNNIENGDEGGSGTANIEDADKAVPEDADFDVENEEVAGIIFLHYA